MDTEYGSVSEKYAPQWQSGRDKTRFKEHYIITKGCCQSLGLEAAHYFHVSKDQKLET